MKEIKKIKYLEKCKPWEILRKYISVAEKTWVKEKHLRSTSVSSMVDMERTDQTSFQGDKWAEAI